MSIFLKYTWSLIFNDIWDALLPGPIDVYKELLESFYYQLGYDKILKSEILSDPGLASEEFRQIPSTPLSEQKCIKILAEFYNIIKELYGNELADRYSNNLKRVFEKYNLRYTILNNCRIGLSIQGVLDSMLFTLHESIKGKSIREQTIQVLEENLAKLDNTFASTKNCISDASNVVEGAVIDKSTNGKNTLTAALDGCPKDMFAHESLNDAIKSLYKFFSDQPGVRHAGLTISNPKRQKTSLKKQTSNNSQKNSVLDRLYHIFATTKSDNYTQQKVSDPQTIRNLKLNDAFLSTALAISFASFIATNDDGKTILYGEI